MINEEKKKAAREWQRRYRKEHPEKVKATSRKTYEKHRNKRIKENREYALRNIEKTRLDKLEWQRRNKDKVIEYRKSFKERFPDRAKETDLKKNYGITLEAYTLILKEQNGVCAICKKPETTKHNNSDKTRALAVDHDHKTGKVRGLLCGRCNQAIGLLDDNEERMALAILYIQKHKPKENK